MKKFWITCLIGGIGIAGPATLAHAGLFSSTGEVIAMLANELFIGEAEGHLNGAGTIAIHAQRNPALTCLGDFTSSAAAGGKGQLQCSDGTVASFSFKRLSVWRGFGGGSSSRGPLSFAYGVGYLEAAQYLKLPEGKRLLHNGIEVALADN
jgi:hypothetical protein